MAGPLRRLRTQSASRPAEPGPKNRSRKREQDGTGARSPAGQQKSPWRRLWSVLSEGSVARQVFALQIVVVLLLVLAGVAALVLQARSDSAGAARDRSLAVAETLANSPGMVRALRSPDPSAVLQPRAEAARKRSGVDFVVVTNPDGIRYTHPIKNRIGKKFVGTLTPALQGHVHTETIQGTIGRIVQVIVPVRADGRVVGVVSAGIKVHKVSAVVDRQLPLLLGAAAAALI
ncbi:MAG TPA: histidine kinase, partial [Streptomyces sp.]|nr:histidine kinase [Streptomyces sp.]